MTYHLSPGTGSADCRRLVSPPLLFTRRLLNRASTKVIYRFPNSIYLLLEEDIVDGALDYRGRPAIRFKHGRRTSASFIIGVEVAEGIACYGITSNLISYLTGLLGQSTASAAANVHAWSGFGSLFPVVSAIIADSFLSRYRIIVVASFI
ncbi:Protein NRT1/ PTR FAMILY 5.15 [Bienertia sinuspersici]